MAIYRCWLSVSTKDDPWWNLSPTGNLQVVEKWVKIRWNSWRHLAQYWWWEQPVRCRPLAPATQQGQQWIRGQPTMKAGRLFGWELPTPIGGKLSLVLEENGRNSLLRKHWNRCVCVWNDQSILTLYSLIHIFLHIEKNNVLTSNCY